MCIGFKERVAFEFFETKYILYRANELPHNFSWSEINVTGTQVTEQQLHPQFRTEFMSKPDIHRGEHSQQITKALKQLTQTTGALNKQTYQYQTQRIETAGHYFCAIDKAQR